jgi:hypothetical protein
MFRIATDSVTEMSSMKIQTVTPNYISTYNPTRVGHIGMAAKRTLGSGNTETIRLDVTCEGINWDHAPYRLECFSRVETIYRAYKAKISQLS